jgi:hypothetical protein
MGKLPLKAAYAFAKIHGLEAATEKIKKTFGTNKIKVGSSTSSITRGWIIILFQSKGVFDEFWQKHWQFYQTRPGKTESRRCLRLVLKSSFRGIELD